MPRNIDTIADHIQEVLTSGNCFAVYRATLDLACPLLLLAKGAPQDFSKLRYFLIVQDDPDLNSREVKTTGINAAAPLTLMPHSEPGDSLTQVMEVALALTRNTDPMSTMSHDVLWDHNYHRGPCKCVDVQACGLLTALGTMCMEEGSECESHGHV